MAVGFGTGVGFSVGVAVGFGTGVGFSVGVAVGFGAGVGFFVGVAVGFMVAAGVSVITGAAVTDGSSVISGGVVTSTLLLSLLSLSGVFPSITVFVYQKLQSTFPVMPSTEPELVYCQYSYGLEYVVLVV